MPQGVLTLHTTDYLPCRTMGILPMAHHGPDARPIAFIQESGLLHPLSEIHQLLLNPFVRWIPTVDRLVFFLSLV